jgi:hypothetical protein
MSTTIYLVEVRQHEVAADIGDVDERFRAAQTTHQLEIAFKLVDGRQVHIKAREIAFVRAGRG